MIVAYYLDRQPLILFGGGAVVSCIALMIIHTLSEFPHPLLLEYPLLLYSDTTEAVIGEKCTKVGWVFMR